MSCRSSRSSCRSLVSACLRYLMSVPVAYHRTTFPLSSINGCTGSETTDICRLSPERAARFRTEPSLRNLSAALRGVSERLLDGTRDPGSYRRALRPETAPCTQLPRDLRKCPFRPDSKPHLFVAYVQ